MKGGYDDCETEVYKTSNDVGSENQPPAESTSAENNISRKKRRVDAFSQVASTSSFVEIETTLSSIQLIKTTNSHNVYCISTPDGMRVLKTTLTDNPSIDNIQNLDNELKIGHQISHHAFRKSYGKTIYQNRKALLLEWVDGKPVGEFAKFTISTFFEVAREMVSCLLALHSNKVCHLNLTCDHIIFNPESKSIKIIGCGSCSSFCSKQSYSPKLLERDLRYISPEQTGRVNRDVDFRSDFYSLGIIFYYLLTGVYPFDSSNASKVIKMHIFQEPTPLHVLDPNIPIPLSDMVSKLMSKRAAGRYQSAKGIIHDVDLIISEYKSELKLTLAQHDVSETLILPQKLYGRDSEYRTLLSVYDRVVESSSFELVLVKASSGMGKSALVLELMKPTLQKGMFIHGKFDCSNFEPYSALTEAVNMFCENIVLEDETTREKYCSLIQDAVGEEGQLLTNTVVSLKTIIGEQRDAFESFGLDAKNRFEYVFVKFLKAIASINSPLVLVIDDLQWADSASLQLIKALIKGPIQNFMLIGLYRDNEINSEHPIINFLHEVDNMDVSTTEIKLDNMDSECVNEFISEALCISPLDSYPLTALIHKKTTGNPFFVKQMVHNLWEQKIITFSLEKSKWQWDLDGHDLAGNILDLLRQKILSMNNQSQEALIVASCLESPFSLSSLVLIINDTKGVQDAIALGIINQTKGSDKCCFVHDQFKHAAKSLLPENPKPLYLSLARKLSKLLSSVDLEENIVDVTNLYYSAKDMIDKNEHFEVAELFLLAGETKFKITAFDKALKYFEAGIELLDEDIWQTNYKFCLKIHNYAAKSAYCERNYNRMNELIGDISKNAKSLLDLVTSYLLIIKMHNDNRMHDDAIQVGFNIVEKLGERIESNQFIIASEIKRTKSLILQSMDNVMEINELKDRRLLSIMEILNTLLYSCFFVGDGHVLATMSLKMVQLTFAHGISMYSSMGFCAFATVLCRMNDNLAYDFGKLSFRLLEKTNAKIMIPICNIYFFGGISPFFAPLHDSLIPLKKMARVSLEVGSNHFAATSVSGYSAYSFYCGESLLKLIDDMTQCEETFTLRTKLQASIHQAALNLNDLTMQNPSRLKGEKFDYEFCFDEHGVKSEIVRASTVCIIVAYLFDDIKMAYELLKNSKPLLKYYGISYGKVIFYFYEGLVASEIVRSINKNDEFMEILRDNITALDSFSEDSPQNNIHKFYLLKAELAVIQNEESEAKSYYEKAISKAKENGFVNEAAIAYERAALLYYDLESEAHAIELLFQSCECYKAWGAFSKINHLAEKYPALIERLKDAPTTSNTDFQDTSINNHDAESVSVVTDAFSSTSISVWQEQKQLIKKLID